jgi:stage II sporulation protein D
MFKFDKIMEGGRVAFLSIAGGGNGHGVGMCQGGAIAMAKKGYTYRMILQHYYPGCDVVRTYQ